jgi:hypothetical protein
MYMRGSCWSRWVFFFLDVVLILGQMVVVSLLECIATTVISAEPSALNNTVGFVLIQLIMD